jgi:murein DD-endopeptidase MepM/ murein hydrolase activator NlpD
MEPTLLAPAAEPPTDWSIMRAFARIASALDRQVPAEVTDGVVRWELAARDELHELQASLIASLDHAGWIIPDLTVLAIEPVAHTESSGFGWRDDPIRHTRSYHSGTDFRGDPGTPVMAAGDGVVSFVGRRGGYGNVIDIDHGGGVITRYAHLRRIETKKDAAVTAGDRIGQVGSTGRTTGPHLHFEVRLDGSPVSPIAAMSIAALQRESPIAGRLAALALAPELQAAAMSDVDPPRQRARAGQATKSRPERAGRANRPPVLW